MHIVRVIALGVLMALGLSCNSGGGDAAPAPPRKVLPQAPLHLPRGTPVFR